MRKITIIIDSKTVSKEQVDKLAAHILEGVNELLFDGLDIETRKLDPFYMVAELNTLYLDEGLPEIESYME